MLPTPVDTTMSRLNVLGGMYHLSESDVVYAHSLLMRASLMLSSARSPSLARAILLSIKGRRQPVLILVGAFLPSPEIPNVTCVHVRWSNYPTEISPPAGEPRTNGKRMTD